MRTRHKPLGHAASLHSSTFLIALLSSCALYRADTLLRHILANSSDVLRSSLTIRRPQSRGLDRQVSVRSVHSPCIRSLDRSLQGMWQPLGISLLSTARYTRQLSLKGLTYSLKSSHSQLMLSGLSLESPSKSTFRQIAQKGLILSGFKGYLFAICIILTYSLVYRHIPDIS